MDTVAYRAARIDDIASCIRIRGCTRDNAISEKRLEELGVTLDSWCKDVEDGKLSGFVCIDAGSIGGYCFGNKHTGEIVVLAMLPAYEGKGIAKRLLNATVQQLADHGFTRVFLGCSPNREFRSCGFYRHLGWRPTGRFIGRDEELEFWPNKTA